MTRVGVTGGIGSGKSTVCELFARSGVPVYDSDSRARELMNGGDGKIRRAVTSLLGPGAYRENMLDGAFVAGRVFADRMLLASLNAIVHPAVAEDFEAWAMAKGDFPYVVLESAILFESGFWRLVDRVVTVSAPEQVRLERVCRRSGISREEVMRRMANQLSDSERERRADHIIDNGGSLHELAARVEEIDKLLKQ